MTSDPPVATPQGVTLAEDTSTTIVLTATDTEVDPLTYSIVIPPASGTLSLVTGTNVTYTPNPNFNGGDSFAFVANDGRSNSNVATVTITVTSINDPPTAVDDGETVAEDSAPTALDVLFNDSTTPDTGETLTITDVTQGTNGAVAITGGGTGLTYAPNADFNGADSFTYTTSDGNGGTDIATMTMTVTSVNDPPTVLDDSATVAEDSVASVIDVLVNDSDAPDTGETLTITAVTPGTNGGAVAFTASSVTYTPATDFTGTDTFTYTISDGNGEADTATVTVTVTNVNDPPLANAGPDQAVTAPATVELNGSGSSDIEGTPLTYQWSLTPPGSSTATLSDPTIVNPTFVADQPGIYLIQLIVSDGTDSSTPDSVEITAN